MTFLKPALASQNLSEIFKEQKEKPILLLLSGGSSFKILESVEVKNLSSNVTVSVLDERFSKDPKINNYLLLKESDFFKKAEHKGCHFLVTVPEKGDNPESMAERLAHRMKNWKTANPGGKIIITQGMGEDGHTAGIMPYPENPELFQKLFIDGTNWVVGYDAGDKNQYSLRVTTRLNFLREQVDISLFYVIGVSKREVIKRVLNNEGVISELPALIIHQMKDVRIFIDVN